MEIFQKTEFVADDQITAKLNKMIEGAESDVIICSPWLDDKSHMMDKIVKKSQELTFFRGKQKIHFFVITRPPKNTSHSNALTILKNVGADIYYDPQLHAKILIVDREEMFLGSTNLTSESFTKNHEAGILTYSSNLIESALKYLLDIRDSLQYTQPEETGKGFCIVCQKSILFDSYKVRCTECWSKEKTGVVKGNFCHKCGKECDSTSRRALCDSCFS